MLAGMALTPAEIAEFDDRGFLPREALLTSLEVKALHQRLEDIGNDIVAFPPAFVQIEPQVEAGEIAGDPIRFNNVRKIWSLTKHDALFREYSRHPQILAVVHSLLGPNLKIFVDQTLCKPPRVGSPKPPHQDSAYWTSIDPPHLVVCWMALDDATEDNGCMRFIPGSHKLGVVEHQQLEDFRVEDAKVDYSSEVAVPLTAGGCSFHHSLAMHRTDANTSSQRRIGVTVAYMSAESKYIGSGPQPEYELVAGQSFPGCV
jgi:ectoine hydroxylase-related dioxygenase (phytanoyl-CoA dioxygenase family)